MRADVWMIRMPRWMPVTPYRPRQRAFVTRTSSGKTMLVVRKLSAKRLAAPALALLLLGCAARVRVEQSDSVDPNQRVREQFPRIDEYKRAYRDCVKLMLEAQRGSGMSYYYDGVVTVCGDHMLRVAGDDLRR